jgi:hypothetical protein
MVKVLSLFSKPYLCLVPNWNAPFHVIKNINKELNELRKRMKVHEKGLKYMLWKNKEDLEEEKKEGSTRPVR